MLHGSIICALIGYLVSAGFFLFGLLRQQGKVAHLATSVLRVSVLFHLIAAVLFVYEQGSESFAKAGDYYFWLSLLIGALFLWLGRKLLYPSIAALVSGGCALFLVSSSILAHRVGVQGEAGSFVIIFHVIPAVFAEALLLLSWGGAMLFLFQERRLKKKALDGLLLQSPSLDALGAFTEKALLLGFFAMSFAMISGVLWGFSEGASLLKGDPVVIGALLAWVMLAAILHLRHSRAWSLKKISKLTVWTVALYGAFLVIIAVQGELFHGL